MKESEKGYTLNKLLVTIVPLGIMAAFFISRYDFGPGGITEPELSPDAADYEEFTKGDGQEIVMAIDELRQYKRKRVFAITRLEQTLSRPGLNPDNDFDLVLWKHQVDELENEIESLENRLNNAYLAFIKMKYSPDSSSRAAMARAIDGANLASRDAIKKYRAIMTGMSADR
jgi:hypothetical protein